MTKVNSIQALLMPIIDFIEIYQYACHVFLIYCSHTGKADRYHSRFHALDHCH